MPEEKPATRYQVLNWDANFENNKSRDRDSCRFVCTPNKQHGMGLTFILSLPDGGCVYGIWCLIIGALSQQRRPRLGWLTDDGTATGRPWTIRAMSQRWRRSIMEIGQALEELTSQEVAWMRKESARRVPAECPPSAPEWKGKEGNGKEGNPLSTGGSSEPEIPASEPTPEPAVLIFQTVGRGPKTWAVTEKFIAQLAADYPALDVPQQCRGARAWIGANQSRRKTSRGMEAFMVNWMNRAIRQGDGKKNGVRLSPVAADQLVREAKQREAQVQAEKSRLEEERQAQITTLRQLSPEQLSSLKRECVEAADPIFKKRMDAADPFAGKMLSTLMCARLRMVEAEVSS